MWCCIRDGLLVYSMGRLMLVNRCYFPGWDSVRKRDKQGWGVSIREGLLVNGMRCYGMVLVLSGMGC